MRTLNNFATLFFVVGALSAGCSSASESETSASGGSGDPNAGGSGGAIPGAGGNLLGGAGGTAGGPGSGGSLSGGTAGVITGGAGATGGTATGGAVQGGTVGTGGDVVATGGTAGIASGGTAATGGATTGGATTGGGAGTATGGTGGSPTGGTGGDATGGVANTGGTITTGPLLDRISTTDVAIPEGVEEGVRNWRIWGSSSLLVAPVYTVPLSNCGTLVCYTTDSGSTLTARVAYLDPNDQLVNTFTVGAGLECRGLAAEPDGHFAALVWDDAADRIYVNRFDLTGTQTWSEELTNSDNSPTDFGIGESRLEYGNGMYGAYYHVHSNSGHEGDTLKWVDAQSGTESTEWGWGCSHSMSNLLRYNPAVSEFLPVCVTDCYPGTDGDFETQSQGGIYLNHDDSKVLDVDGGCNGSVAGELGGAALAPDGWKLVFNAHQAPMTLGQSSYDESTMNQDIGFSAIGASLSAGAVVWLTSTPSIDEADSSIARWQPSDDATEQYLVGWSEPGSSYTYQLARVDAAGNFLEGPIDVTAAVQWGRRDDPFRTHYNGDVVWAWFDAPGSTTLHVARVSSGGTASCASY